MPKEKRQIMFSELELRRALLDFATRRGCPYNLEDHLPRLSMSAEDEVVAQLVHRDQPSVDFDSRELLTAMIAFCKRAYIPLPRLVPKHLEIQDQALVMVMGSLNVGSVLSSVSQRFNVTSPFKGAWTSHG